MLSIFYTRKGECSVGKHVWSSWLNWIPEIATRIALLYCAQILATGFSGLIAAGIFAGMDGLNGIAGWRWLFIMQEPHINYDPTSC